MQRPREHDRDHHGGLTAAPAETGRDAVSDELCYRDAYAREAEARVLESPRPTGPPLVVLDHTLFYPGGGGQPAGSRRDPAHLGRPRLGRARGAAGRAARSSTSWSAGRRRAARRGRPRRIDLEWARRYALMRTHTALHALCGVVWRDYGAQVTGGNMEPGTGRMDFEFETMSGTSSARSRRRSTRSCAAARDVRVNVLPREEAFAIPDLIRTKVNLLPPGIEEIRTIEIVGLDLQADGGTHVANTREVGGIRVTGYESKGRINKRIRLELVDPA